MYEVFCGFYFNNLIIIFQPAKYVRVLIIDRVYDRILHVFHGSYQVSESLDLVRNRDIPEVVRQTSFKPCPQKRTNRSLLFFFFFKY
jgi:hypothetical protein